MRLQAKTILFGLGCVLLLLGCGGGDITEETQPRYRPVRAKQVFASGGKRLRTFSGVARAGLESRLSFRVGGTIADLPVRVGERVKAGHLIASLDPKDFRLQMQEAEAGLVQAEAQARNQAANYQRIRGLYENQNVSIHDLDAARAATESANAKVEAIRQNLAMARSQLDYTQLVSPVSGVIAQVLAEAGENVTAGQAIAVLNAGSKSEVTVAIPEVLIASVRQGGEATVRFDALPGKVFEATITEVGVATSNLSTTFPVTMRLNDVDKDVLQGMAAEVSILFGSEDSKPKLYVPPNAVAEDQSGRFVYIVQPKEGGLAEVNQAPVKTGELTDEGLEISEGLQDGSWLVTAGIRFLKDGMTVRLPESMKEDGK